MHDEAPDSLLATGERLVTSVRGDTTTEHLHRYALAREWAAGCDVLDVASGEGYGSALLARVARQVTGVDIDPEAVAHAAGKYVRQNLQFVTGSATAIPLPSSSIDLAVSFETIEHLGDHGGMLRELRRILRPGGRLMLSSPDRREYSEASRFQNPFHVKELDRAELEALLRQHFPEVRLLAQRMIYGSAIAAAEEARALQTYAGGFDEIRAEAGLPRARYWVALCSALPLPELPASVFVDETELKTLTDVATTYQVEPARGSWTARWPRLWRTKPEMSLDAELPCILRSFVVTLRGNVPAGTRQVRARIREKVFSGEVTGETFSAEVNFGKGRHVCAIEVCAGDEAWREVLRVRLKAPEIVFKAYARDP
jgi:SAM-dependent methyltransferase